MAQSHETLVAWQRADDLCVSIFSLTQKGLPAGERYVLATQLRRAAYSVAANIVEGYAFAEGPIRMRFLRIALGSLAEVGYGLHLAHRVGYLTDAQYLSLDRQARMTVPTSLSPQVPNRSL